MNRNMMQSGVQNTTHTPIHHEWFPKIDSVIASVYTIWGKTIIFMKNCQDTAQLSALLKDSKFSGSKEYIYFNSIFVTFTCKHFMDWNKITQSGGESFSVDANRTALDISLNAAIDVYTKAICIYRKYTLIQTLISLRTRRVQRCPF